MKANGDFTEEKFEQYDKEHPYIYAGFVRYTMQVAKNAITFLQRRYFIECDGTQQLARLEPTIN